jgi:hypothetical protein
MKGKTSIMEVITTTKPLNQNEIVEMLEEGWVIFRRYLCKEGHIDVWHGDQSCDPNLPDRPHYNINTNTTYLRCNGSEWLNRKDLKVRNHYLSYLDMRTEFTAEEIWKELTYEISQQLKII